MNNLPRKGRLLIIKFLKALPTGEGWVGLPFGSFLLWQKQNGCHKTHQVQLQIVIYCNKLLHDRFILQGDLTWL